MAHELIEDDVDRWIPFAVFRREKKSENNAIGENMIGDMWKADLETLRYEAQYRRGKWLLPRYEGFERRSRSRQTQEQVAMRQTDVKDAASIMSLWGSGQQLINRFAGSIQPVSVPPALFGPSIDARPQDMPSAARPVDIMFESIAREANAGDRELAQKRSVESQELLVANELEDPGDASGKRCKVASIGL